MSNYEMCSDNRFEVIKELKKYIIEATNIETSPKEMEVLDDICFRLWQLGLTLETKNKLKSLEKENQKLKNVIKFLGEQLGLEVDLENHNLITDDGTIGFVNADSETMSILELLKEVLE